MWNILARSVAAILVVPLCAQAAQPADVSPRPERCPGRDVDWQPDVDAPPVLFVTGETIERLRDNVTREGDPWKTAWQRVRDRADEGLRAEPQPYLGDDFREMLAQGQQQSALIRAMAVRWRVTGERQYADKARDMLLAWSTSDPVVGSTPPVTTQPAPGAPWGNEPDVGLLMAVLAVGMADAYTVIYPHLDAEEAAAVEEWFRYLAGRVQEGRRHWIANDFYGQQYYNNHLSLQNMAVAALGFALKDEVLVRWVFDGGTGDYFDMLCGAILMPSKPPTQFWHRDKSRQTRPGEIYDRYRITTIRGGKGRGIDYSFLHLRGLLLTTEMAFNNGLNLYDYTGPHGQSLKLAYEQLAPYLITFDPAHYGDYHAGDQVSPFQADMYEILYRRLGEGEDDLFRRVLEKADRVQDMPYVMGYSAVLLYGEPLPDDGR